MGFWRRWFAKLWLLIRYKFVRAIDIRPFLKADPNEVCPVCGWRDGEIQAVTDGTNAAVSHHCKMCNWIWQTPSVTEIDPKTIVHVVPTEKESEEEDPRLGPRFIRIPPKGEGATKVNNETLGEDKNKEKPAVAVIK